MPGCEATCLIIMTFHIWLRWNAARMDRHEMPSVQFTMSCNSLISNTLDHQNQIDPPILSSQSHSRVFTFLYLKTHDRCCSLRDSAPSRNCKVPTLGTPSAWQALPALRTCGTSSSSGRPTAQRFRSRCSVVVAVSVTLLDSWRTRRTPERMIRDATLFRGFSVVFPQSVP